MYVCMYVSRPNAEPRSEIEARRGEAHWVLGCEGASCDPLPTSYDARGGRCKLPIEFMGAEPRRQ